MTTFVYEAYLAAFIIGLMGAGHCLGMCGGITAALSFAIADVSPRKKWLLLVGYNIGRVLSYICAGVIVGFLGKQIMALGGLPILRIVAGILLILMGFYIAGWWKVLTRLEYVGQRLWRYIKPLGDKVMPVRSLPQAIILGGTWGWLPCGLVYSALAYAIAQAGGMEGGLVMLAFGLGTLPAVLLSGASASLLKTILSKKIIQYVMGIFLCMFGVWTIFMSMQHHNHHDHGAHMQHDLHMDGSQDEDTDLMPEHHHHH